MMFFKQGKNRQRVMIVAVLLSMAVSLFLTGCSAGQQTETEPAVPTESEEEVTTAPATEPTVESTTEPVTEPVIEEPVGIPVATPYMTFHYPEEWADKVEVQQADDGKNCTLTFQTEISGQELVLFSFVLGPDEAEGFLLGQLHDDQAGTVNVYCVMNEMDPEEWTDEEYDEICAHQERVNDMIFQLHEDGRFVPNR